MSRRVLAVWWFLMCVPAVIAVVALARAEEVVYRAGDDLGRVPFGSPWNLVSQDLSGLDPPPGASVRLWSPWEHALELHVVSLLGDFLLWWIPLALAVTLLLAPKAVLQKRSRSQAQPVHFG